MTLPDQLRQLADTAPRPHVDHTVWDRGRALRRRDRLVTSVVVLVMVLLVGGLASLVLGPPRAISPADRPVPEGAIPSRIHDVPADADLPLETDLAIGQASAAFIADRRPVVVGASDGAYHLLDLPGWTADSVLALSPSGDRLAWLSSGTGTSTPMLNRLTLATGELTTTDIALAAGLRATSVAWSPDSERLAWLGAVPSGSAFGSIEVADGRRESAANPSQRRLIGVAVADDGALAVGTQSGGLILDVHTSDWRRIAESDGFPTSFSPDGTVLALETRLFFPESSTVEVATRKQWRHPFPVPALEATTRPLGWLDDRLQLLLLQEDPREPAEFVITTPQLTTRSTWRRGIGSVDPEAAGSLTVAVDLMPDLDGTSSQTFTHDFGDPEWAGQRDVSWLIGLGVAGALSVLYGIRWVWRRRTHLV